MKTIAINTSQAFRICDSDVTEFIRILMNAKTEQYSFARENRYDMELRVPEMDKDEEGEA